jgi:hypothetical protein
MTAADIIAALDLPPDCRVDQRVPKARFESTAPTPADRRVIRDGIAEIRWHAALKPRGIAVPAYKDAVRDYVEILIFTAVFRENAKAGRLTELIHRASPYPLVLVAGDPPFLSLAHKRQSQAETAKVVIDEVLHSSGPLAPDTPGIVLFLADLALARQQAADLHALYQCWIDRVTTLQAAAITGTYHPDATPTATCRVREALAERRDIDTRIQSLRAQAARETQISRRVDLNLEIKKLEATLAGIATRLQS